MFRSLLVILFFLSQIEFSHSQCIAEAGPDTTVCMINSYDTLVLGGNPTGSSGIGTYTYEWTALVDISPTLKFYASDFLDDTTSANPRLINPYIPGLTYHVKVTDFLGNTCTDSIEVQFCRLLFTLIDHREYICPGDTVTLFTNGHSFCGPNTYEWFPKYNISDPYSPTPQVWPDTTTYYYARVTDSQGCQWDDEINEIEVCVTGLESRMEAYIANAYPIPFEDEIIIEKKNYQMEIETILLLNEAGQLISRMKAKGDVMILDTRDIPSGMYILVIEAKSQVQRTKVFKR